jgi:dTDP-4-dehydrorhamnose 3,5-epimerase
VTVTETKLPGVLVLEPRVFSDVRGTFFESFRSDACSSVGIDVVFVQDNVSVSRRGVLRGLHFQHPHGQAKLINAVRGEIFDVAVDVRAGSPTFGCAAWTVLSEKNRRQLFIPAGFAHGFVVTSDEAIVLYKCSAYYEPACEHSLRWDDPALRIPWPVTDPILSAKDATAPLLSELSAGSFPTPVEG